MPGSNKVRIFRTSSEAEIPVQSGDFVLIKPNWVRHGQEENIRKWEHIITHPDVLVPILKSAVKQAGPTGRVMLGDAPQTESSFSKIIKRGGLSTSLRDFPTVELVDLRQEEWVAVSGVTVAKKKLPGDPLGYTKIELGGASEFAADTERKYYGAAYDINETNRNHHGKVHNYMIATSALACDLFLCVPKWKTHKKTGLTGALKNLVGVNGNKNWLPHYTIGSQGEGGDQFAEHNAKTNLEAGFIANVKQIAAQVPVLSLAMVPAKWLAKPFLGGTEDIVRSGNWYGNNTTWRMVLDLNKVVRWFNADGTRRLSPRRMYSVMDGIIAGEGNGPLNATPIKPGIIIAGESSVAVDCVAAKLMGFDWQKVPMLREAFRIKELPLVDFDYDDIEVVSDDRRFNGPLHSLKHESVWRFKPHFGWANNVELT